MSSMGPSSSTTPIPAPSPNMPGVNAAFQGEIGTAGADSISTLDATSKGAPGSPGSATDVSTLFAAIKNASDTTRNEGEANILEQFGSSGARFGSDMMRSLADYNLQYGKNLDQTLADLEFKSTESAKDRQIQASTVLEDTYANAAMGYHPTAVVNSGPSGGSQVIQGAVGTAMVVAMFV